MLLRLCGALLPALQLWPDGLASRLIELMTLPHRAFQSDDIELEAWRPVADYVHHLQSVPPPGHEGWSVALTGHSLGGGIATIAGATLDVSAVAFSPPGLVRSRRKFGWQPPGGAPARRASLERAARRLVSFIPNRDVVPMADAHHGAVQHTLCNESHPVECHMLERLVCDLLARCGGGGGGGGSARVVGCAYERGEFGEHFSESARELRKRMTARLGADIAAEGALGRGYAPIMVAVMLGVASVAAGLVRTKT